MKVRIIRQFFIQPKTFHSISFHHQGFYTIRLTLVKINSQGQKTYGYPIIQKGGLQGQSAATQMQKSAKISFYTQEFQIMYNDQTHQIKHGCLFKMEYSPSDNHSTYLDFQLMKRDSQNPNTNYSSREIVGKNRLYFNIGVNEDHSLSSSYQKVLFNKSEYYSSLYIFVEHVKVGMRLRLNDYQLCQFESMKQHERQQYVNMNKEQNIILHPRYFKCFSFQQLYRCLIENSLQQYNKVKNWHHKLLTILAMYHRQNNNNVEQVIPKSLDYILINHKGMIKQLCKHYEVDNYGQLYLQIYKQSIIINQNVKYVWNKCIDLILKMRPTVFMKNVEQCQELNLKLVLSNFQVLQKDTEGIKWSQLIQIHKQKRENLIKNVRFYFQDTKIYPMIIASRQIIKRGGIEQVKLLSSEILTVLVHGYQGSESDMSRIKSHLFQFINTSICIVKGIQNIMTEDIQTLSLTVAKQIKQFLAEKSQIKRINIIGFSLGGVIARGALRHLSEYKNKFNILITFATPHLGVTLVSNCLVKTGLAYFNNIARVKNMRQLSYKDKQQQFLQQLSKCECLQWFKHMVVVGSQDDSFIPIESALLDYNGSDSKLRMIQDNILSKVRIIHRLNIWFDLKQNIFEWAIGRKFHISFIESDIFLQFFFSRYWKLF